MKLTRHRRMKSWGEFREVREARNSAGGKFLVMSAAKRSDGEESRFGLITSRKVGIAVKRNGVRRRLREVIRAHGEVVQPGWRVVAIARWNAPQASYAELERDWLKLMRRMKLLREEAGDAQE